MSQQTKEELSILIPNYNNVCVGQVRDLLRQVEPLGITFEIIVADDASTEQDSIRANEVINSMPHCRYIVKQQNTGSAATRNFLARQSQYPWLLFIDADVTIPEHNFIRRYLESDCQGVVNGGISIAADHTLDTNLRYRYERQAEPAHTAEQRGRNQYREFRSTNFLIARDDIMRCPFDERFLRSGYEDVMFGKQLQLHDIHVSHICNPVIIERFENNADFVAKTERQLHTLYDFRNELRGYSRLLTFVDGIHSRLLRRALLLWHKLFGRLERRQLCGRHPSLRVFKLYKLGYYLQLEK